MPLNELATSERTAGVNTVLRKLKAGCVSKVFLSKEADPAVLEDILREAEAACIPVEWVEESLQLGRACAIPQKAAAAAILKK